MRNEDLFLFFSFFIFLISLFVFFEKYLVVASLISGKSVGGVSVEVDKNLRIGFIVGNINFGEGYVTENSTFSKIDTLGNVVNGTWSSTNQGFVIKNMGNVNATINLSSTKDAWEFIGGSSPSYKYNVSNLLFDGCFPGEGFNLGEFYDVSVYPNSRKVCSVFLPNGQVRVDIELVIPYNSKLGNLTDVFYVISSEAS